MAKRVKHPKAEDLHKYTNKLLHDSWPKIMKKLGLDINARDIPRIRICKSDSCVDPEFPDSINLNYGMVLKAYKNKYKKFQGLDIPYRSLCLEDVIHETVHYIQDEFFDIQKSGFGCSIEGLAMAVSFDILIKSEDYKNPVTGIADMFHKTNVEYKDYFKLPKEYNRHIKKILKDKEYKPQSLKEYASGFVYICEYCRPVNENFLELLIKPFSNEECYNELELIWDKKW